MVDGVQVCGGDLQVGDKIEFEWQRNIPLSCRHCDNYKYISPLAYELHKLVIERNMVQAAINAAIRAGSERVQETLEKLLTGR